MTCIGAKGGRGRAALHCDKASLRFLAIAFGCSVAVALIASGSASALSRRFSIHNKSRDLRLHLVRVEPLSREICDPHCRPRYPGTVGSSRSRDKDYRWSLKGVRSRSRPVPGPNPGF